MAKVRKQTSSDDKNRPRFVRLDDGNVFDYQENKEITRMYYELRLDSSLLPENLDEYVEYGNLSEGELPSELSEEREKVKHQFELTRRKVELEIRRRKREEEIDILIFTANEPRPKVEKIKRVNLDEWLRSLVEKTRSLKGDQAIHLYFPDIQTIMQSDYLAGLISAGEIRVSVNHLPTKDNDSTDALVDSYCQRLKNLHEYFLKQNSPGLPKAHEKIIQNANDYALSIGKIINQFHEQGKLTLQEKAEALEEAKVPTPRGKDKWETSSIRKIYLRWQELTGNKVDVSSSYTSKSEDFAKQLMPILKELEDQGFKTIQSKAEELNRRKIPTYRGTGQWQSGSVFNVQRRIEKLQSSGDSPKPK